MGRECNEYLKTTRSHHNPFSWNCFTFSTTCVCMRVLVVWDFDSFNRDWPITSKCFCFYSNVPFFIKYQLNCLLNYLKLIIVNAGALIFLSLFIFILRLYVHVYVNVSTSLLFFSNLFLVVFFLSLWIIITIIMKWIFKIINPQM